MNRGAAEESLAQLPRMQHLPFLLQIVNKCDD